MTTHAIDLDLEELNKTWAERTCRVGSPRGPTGTIEYVYQARGRDAVMAKVLMDSGAIRRCDLAFVYVR